MNKKGQDRNVSGWNIKAWLYVIICIFAIYLTVPLARSIQIYIYDTLGKEFFTYIVLIIICAGLVTLLYLFIFKLQIRNTSQYIWIIICAGSCVYLTIHLRKYPEEAVHLLEYGLLSILVFNALSYKIRDRSVYVIAGFIVLLVGILDEFIQWLIPGRYWGYNDVAINGLAGVFFLVAIAKGVRPGIISSGISRASINFLFRIITVNAIIFALCLSNTPERVLRYSSSLSFLTWLQNEEPMTEYGYKHVDNEIGILFSRFPLKKLTSIDQSNGQFYGTTLQKEIGNKPPRFNELKEIYRQDTHPFVYEFLSHVSRRNENLKTFDITATGKENNEAAFIALKENEVVEKYFPDTLKHSSLEWSGDIKRVLLKADPPENEEFISKPGNLITRFNQVTAWLGIAIILIAAWISCEHWKKRVGDDLSSD
jgi:VanZ family protein